jgi:hypothetical protein
VGFRPVLALLFLTLKVFDAIFKIKSNSVGLDHLTYIFNTSISGIFPAAWKFSVVVLIVKIPDPLEPAHLKPIGILPALSKALEILIRDQMVCFLESVSALNVFQSVFRSGHSTVTALLNITFMGAWTGAFSWYWCLFFLSIKTFFLFRLSFFEFNVSSVIFEVIGSRIFRSLPFQGSKHTQSFVDLVF